MVPTGETADVDFATPAAFRPGPAWYAVGLLALLYAVSFMDRFMLALLIGPVSREIAISDTYIGLLLGGGFAAVYAIGGIPLAYALDNYERRRILLGGVVLWSLATIVSAFAQSFTSLILCRSAVALGEAVLTPAAVSLIADLFPREKRGLPISIYAAVSSVMVTGAFIANGLVLDLAGHLSVGLDLSAWRLALVLVGLPGLLLALLFGATVREPRRGAIDGHGAVERPGRPPEPGDEAFTAYLLRQWRFFLPFYCAVGCLSMYSFSVVTWLPTIIVRRFGETAVAAGLDLGSVGVPAALCGVFLWPWIAGRLDRSGGKTGIMTSFLIATACVMPLLVLMPLAGDRGTLLWACFLTIACTSASGCLVQLAVQAYGPDRVRARLMAVALLVMNLIGYTVGPLMVAVLAKNWPGDGTALAKGLASLGAACGILALLAVAVARQAVTRTALLAEVK